MRRLTFSCGVLLIAGGVFSAPQPTHFSSFQGPFQSIFDKETPHISGEPLHSVSLLKQFYENRAYTLTWSKNGNVTEDGIELLSSIESAYREGLEPTEYHLWSIKRMVGEIRGDNQRLRKVAPLKLFYLDLLMSDAFLTYGSHLLSGRIRPVDEDWVVYERTAHLPTVLEEAFKTNQIRKVLKSLLPTQPYYARLRIALDRYRKIERDGGWEQIASGPVIKLGSDDARVPALRERLFIEGDLRVKPSSGTVFDETLERALISFQERHGVEASGNLGPLTLAALNVPVNKRIRQIVLNMERCRWLPVDMGRKYILVNVAEFSLNVMEEGESALNMKVVVGRPYRRTPVFSSTMTYLVINPTWYVPQKVAGLDILDHIREEPDYLQKMGFSVYRSNDEKGVPVDPSGIDWSKYTLENLDYRFVQAPGPQNALGRIKFIFPNDFDVYLHDTPSRNLFNKTVRDFSSGCIRVEKPLELAVYVMQSSEWDEAALEKAIASKGEKVVALKEPMPVHLLYWTAWGDARGRVQFRDDIYSRDEPLEQALRGALKGEEG